MATRGTTGYPRRLMGWRKVVIYTEGLIAFVLAIWLLTLRESAAILAVGTTIIGLVSAAIYGNIKVHQSGSEDASA